MQTSLSPRQGPRPLPLHLIQQGATLLSSRLALPGLRAGSLSWNPALQAKARELEDQAASLSPDLVEQAVEREARRRMADFLTGIERYRAHPYRRPETDLPVVWQEGSTRLLDYSLPGAEGPAVLVVPSLINRAYILDLTPKRSLMRYFAAKGLRPLLLDWGHPGAVEAEFGLADYIRRGALALDAVQDRHGVQRLGVAGYCMGGTLALAIALRRPRAVKALALMASPWDFHAGRPGLARLIELMRPWIEDMLKVAGVLPVDALQTLFTAVDPTLVERKFRQFASLPRRSAKLLDFVVLEDWVNDGVPLAGGVARECLFGWYGENQPALGRWRLDGEVVDPAALTCPALLLAAGRDRLVPPDSALALADRLASPKRRLVSYGHIGMITGGRARTDVYGPLTKWLNHHAGP